MIETYLVPENTKVTEKGDGAAVDVTKAGSRVFLAALKITSALEQESLDVAVFTSVDGETWSPKPVAAFPQKFYAGETPLLVYLTVEPEAKFVRAHWDVNRWGRGPQTPEFEFAVSLKEVSPELLREAQAEARSR